MIDSPQVINAILFYKVKIFLVINSTNDVIMPRLKSGFLYLLHPWHWQRWTQHCNIKIRVTISNKTFTELLTFMFWPATYLIYFYSISYIKPDIPFFLNTKEQIPPVAPPRSLISLMILSVTSLFCYEKYSPNYEEFLISNISVKYEVVVNTYHERYIELWWKYICR